MSKYTDIFNACRNSQAHFRHCKFSENLLNRLLRWFEVPVANILLYKQENDEFISVETLFESINMIATNQSEFSFGISLTEEVSEHPFEIIIIRIEISEFEINKFSIRTGADYVKEIRVEKDFDDIFEQIYNLIMDSYKSEYSICSEKKDEFPIRYIGHRFDNKNTCN